MTWTQDDYLRHVAESVRASSDARDRAVMTLLAGALTLSITFMHDIAPTPHALPWVVAAWGALAASLPSVVCSLVTAEFHQRRTYEAQAMERDESVSNQKEALVKTRTAAKWATATAAFNIASVALLALGLILLLVFATSNA